MLRLGLLIAIVAGAVAQEITLDHKKPVLPDQTQTTCRPGCKGQSGDDGPTGEDGSRGAPGVRGARGDDGQTLRRPVKIQVIKGDMGFKGIPGPAGVPGHHGSHGIPGIPGAPGPVGRKGMKGHEGFPGAQGVPGVDGPSGNKGDIGDVGPPGLMGLHGDRGQKGTRGETGGTGFGGENGVPGANGPNGAPGSPGDPGQEGLRGPPGAKGDDGRVGIVGAKGDQGFEGIIGSLGPQGGDGEPGEAGPVGQPGELGVEGDAGDIGPEVYVRLQLAQECNQESAGEVAYDSTLGKLYFCDGENWECVRDGGCAGCEEFVSDWSEWSTCSATCGGGTQTRTRTIQTQLDFQLSNCPLSETRECNSNTCQLCMEGGESFGVGDIVHVLQISDIAADVLLVVDESKSMDPEHAWLPSMVSSLERKLKERGIGSGLLPNLYSLTGFGAGSVLPDQCPTQKRTASGQRLFNADEYSDVNRQLSTAGNGQREDGWHAVKYAVETTPWRRTPGVAHNVILVTDEDRDNDCGGNELTSQMVTDLLQANGFLLNAVLDQHYRAVGIADISTALGMSGSQRNQRVAYIPDGRGSYFNITGVTADISAERPRYNVRTEEHYVDWTLGQGGAVWDLNFLRDPDSRVQQSFTEAFVDIKTREILTQTRSCFRCACVMADGGVPRSECSAVARSECS